MYGDLLCLFPEDEIFNVKLKIDTICCNKMWRHVEGAHLCFAKHCITPAGKNRVQTRLACLVRRYFCQELHKCKLVFKHFYTKNLGQ